jgi:regulator of protease activity HflC (stomatin/prohibitin superfamily)
MESLSVRELRQRCEHAGVNVLGMTEKSEMIEALLAAEAAASKPTVEEVMEEVEDDEALLAQALLMSQESEASLTNLSIRELRERCAARDISTRGMTTKAEMVAALFGGAPSEETPPTEAAASSISAGERLATQPPSEVLATFGVRFACFAAADVPGLPGAAAIEQTGKVLLPRSCLAGLAFLSSLPTTMLLRLSLQERTVYVGVADFIDDHLAFDKASAAGYSMPRWGPGAAGVAAVFVPRWVRSQLAVVDATVGVSLVALPKASAIALQPHTDGFAAALGRCPDPRAVMTELMNRYVAVAVGDVIHLQVPCTAEPMPMETDDARTGARHDAPTGAQHDARTGAQHDATTTGVRYALDVVSLRGLPGTRCGLPEGMGAPLDVAAAFQCLSGAADPSRGVSVRAVCLVDADVECDFRPSLETMSREAAEEAARAEAQQAAARSLAESAEAARAEEAAAAAAAAAAQAARAGRRADARARLPAEPDASDGESISIVVRFADGTRFVRRFAATAPLAALFDAVEASDVQTLPDADKVTLIASYPRRVFHRSEAADGRSLRDAGLTGKQEALFVEW